ncbi:MAG: hemerythrin [Gemmatimonas sp.]|nr:hemerythrin [Gemmatimonas sp.]
MATPTLLDVRTIPPREKHATIFRTFDALAPGEQFTLVNDHDPVPLHYQFQTQRTGAFRWEYVERGPSVWLVEISRR